MRSSWIIRGFLVLLAVSSLASFCEEELPWAPCDGVTCSERGLCELIDDRPVCSCDDGFEPSGLACVPEGTVDDAGAEDADVDVDVDG